MSTAELKEKVLKKIEKIDEIYLLEDLLNLIDFETSKEVFDIPKSHLTSIEMGLAQIESGQTVPNDEVVRRVNLWAGK